jgi:hypothetical protein
MNLFLTGGASLEFAGGGAGVVGVVGRFPAGFIDKAGAVMVIISSLELRYHSLTV